MTIKRPLAAFALGTFSAALLLGPTVAHAQASNCQLDVSRDVITIPTPRAPTATRDGVVLARFALGLRGPQLYEKISDEPNRFVAEGNTGSLIAQLDIDGDGVFTASDAAILARFMSGFTGDALTNGLTFNTAASRKTGATVTAFLNGGCAPTAPIATAQRHAARLLQQGTYGASLDEINRVAGLGGGNPTSMTQAWLAEQFAKGQSGFGNYSQQLIDENKTGAFDWRCSGDNKSWGCAYAANTPGFYKFAMEGDDQLRQRVTNALSQILVVSIANNRLLDAGVTVGDYWDMLGRNAFAAPAGAKGSFRNLLKEATLHPAMGIFLDMLSSSAEVPNENYGRELVQLFAVGTVMLNQDGTPQLSAGKTIPAYDESVVQGFAKAFTGWHFNGADSDPTKPWKFYYPDADWRNAMKPWSLRRCPQNGRWPPGTPEAAPGSNDAAICYSYCDVSKPACSLDTPHNKLDKKLLQYAAPAGVKTTLAAGQTIQQDLEDTIDNVFYHPNVGPFISRQLIQRLITSNPTPGYVSRVAGAFNNSAGVRGDMKAVITAIFTDPEARDVNTANKNWFGKLREPTIKFVHLHRAFNARETQKGYYDVWDTSSPETLGQAAMKAPSVFNYYSPDFGPSGPLAYTSIRPVVSGDGFGNRSREPLLGPEFEITNTSTVAGFSDFWNWGVFNGFAPNYDGGVKLRWQPDHSRYLAGGGALADNPQALVDELDLLLTANNLKPAFKANLVAMVTGITRGDIAEQRAQRFQAVYWQIVNSADYAIQR